MSVTDSPFTAVPLPPGLLRTVLALSEAQRASLAEHLLLSLDAPLIDAGHRADWAEELERRAREAEEHPDRLLTVEEAIERAFESLSQAREARAVKAIIP